MHECNDDDVNDYSVLLRRWMLSVVFVLTATPAMPFGLGMPGGLGAAAAAAAGLRLPGQNTTGSVLLVSNLNEDVSHTSVLYFFLLCHKFHFFRVLWCYNFKDFTSPYIESLFEVLIDNLLVYWNFGVSCHHNAVFLLLRDPRSGRVLLYGFLSFVCLAIHIPELSQNDLTLTISTCFLPSCKRKHQ